MMVIVPTLADGKKGHPRILCWLNSTVTRKEEREVSLLNSSQLHERTSQEYHATDYLNGITACNFYLLRYKREIHFTKFIYL